MMNKSLRGRGPRVQRSTTKTGDMVSAAIMNGKFLAAAFGRRQKKAAVAGG